MIATVKQLMEPVPEWVTDGWYANNPGAQQSAIARFRMPVCTDAEREAARSFVREPAAPCTGCGRFAFAKPTMCFWCRPAGGAS